ncbi:MAG: RHS repeat protein, partial [Clostridia bacterium]|nr:RHS repeat protein [Clostridia bacterium]
MKNTKRIITIILAICLTFSMVPAVSAAEEIKNPAISFNDWDEYVEEMRRKNYSANSDILPEGYDQSVIDAINNNIDNSVPVESGASLEGAMEAVASSSVATKIGETASVQNTTSDSTSTAVAESFTVDHVADPFNMAAGAGDSVSLATGALTYEKTLLSLPGRNGHDLNISVRYNSDNAVITKSAYDIEDVDETVNFNQFAAGWSFGFPYINKREFYGFEQPNDILCFPDGSSYEFEQWYGNDETKIVCELKNYELDEMSLTKEGDEYVLAFSDGRVMRFDYTYGHITSYTDRFDNTITYAYKEIDCYQNSFFDFLFNFNTVSQKKQALSEITDSTGKKIIFDYKTEMTNFEKYVSAVSVKIGKITYATINIKRIKAHDGKVDVVSSIIDAEGYTTSFEYTEEATHYQEASDGKDPFLYSYAGSMFLMTDITLPTTGQISYKYEKARRTFHILTTSYGVVKFSWRETFKVRSRTDSNNDVQWYSYDGDYSGYPNNCIVENGTISSSDYEYKTTVTQGQVSTIHTFDHEHRKISEETYSSGTGFGQFTSVGESSQSVVLNGKIYSVLKKDDYFAIYYYEQISDQSVSVTEPRTLKTVYGDFSWASIMEVKTQGNCIYVFLSDGTKVEIYRIDPADEEPALTYVKTLSFPAGASFYSTIVKYNPERQSFLIFYWTEGIGTLQCYEYVPQGDGGSNLTFAVDTPQTENTHLYCLFSNGNTTYFRSGNYMYKFSMNGENINITYSTHQASISISSGVMLGNGKTYFINDYKLYRYNFVAGGTGSVTAISENENEDIWNIFAGADNILYYSVNRKTDPYSSYDTSEIYSIDTDAVTPEAERIHYCLDSVVYSFLATYNGIYLTNNVNFEFLTTTTEKRTRIKVDYTYNDYDQMIENKKTVIENGSISNQGGESYAYVPGHNAILTHTDILGNETVYEYEDSLYYIPTSITQYANELNDAIAVVTTNTLSADKKKILVSETEYSDALYRTTYTYDDNSANNNETFPGNVMSEKTEYKKHNQNTTSTLNHITYTYDDRDNFVASQTATGILTNTSAFGNKTTVDITTNFTYNDFGQVLTETNAKGQTTAYQYNKNGWQTKVTYPDGTFVSTAYDIGNTNKVTTNYNNEYSTADYFDSIGRATKQTKKVGSGSEKTIAQYSYYLGRIESVSDGTKADYYVYDNFDRVKRVNHGNPTGTSYYSQV